MTPIQLRAAQLLASGLTQEEVGKRVGVSRRTIVRWLGIQEFKNLSFGLVSLNPPEKGKVEIPLEKTETQTNYALSDLVPMAIKTLVDILVDPEARRVDKLKAVSLVGEWAGLTSDFNVALACLRRYGLLICESENGSWILQDQRENPFFHDN